MWTYHCKCRVARFGYWPLPNHAYLSNISSLSRDPRIIDADMIAADTRVEKVAFFARRGTLRLANADGYCQDNVNC